MTTFRACVAFDNLADVAGTVLRATSAAPFLPVQLLRDPHIGRRWRSLGPSATIFVDLGAPQMVDTVALIGTNMTRSGSIRVRTSAVESEAEGNVLADRTIVGGCDPDYGYQIALLDDAAQARFVRIDLEEPGAAFVEAGRLFVGERHQFEINFAYGWNVTIVDPSVKTKSAGGSMFVGKRKRYRLLELTFEHLRPEERWGFVEALDRARGASEDFLIIRSPLDDNLGQSAIWGAQVEVTAIAEQFFRNFAKPYRIEERL